MSEGMNEQALQACARDHSYLDYLVKRKGVLAFSPDTAAGKEILELFDAFMTAANPKREEILRLQGAEKAIESILLRRSIVTQMLMLGKFDQRHTKAGGARRAAMGGCMSALSTLDRHFREAMEMLGIEGYAKLETVADDTESLKQLLKKKANEQAAAEAVDAEFTSVEAASSTTGAAPAPPSYPSPESPASATSEASLDDEDAPVSTPGQPKPPSGALHPGTAEGLKMALALRQSSTSGTQTATPPPHEPASDSPATPDD